MHIETLKEQVLNNNINSKHLIFIDKDTNSSFIAYQYIKRIAANNSLRINFVNTLKELIQKKALSIFATDGADLSDTLDVLVCDTLDEHVEELNYQQNLSIIVAKKVSSKINKLPYIQNCIVSIPTLESWQLYDYIESNCPGLSEEQRSWICSNCDNNIYRINTELDKLTIFTQAQRERLFSSFIYDGAFNDLSQHSIFNLTNAIQARAMDSLVKILPEISRMDVEPVGLLTILINNFKKYLDVWYSPNPTPESTGLNSNTIYAINKAPKVWSRDQLIKAYKLVLGIDEKFKTGQLPVPLILDYLLVKLLSI